MCKKFGIYGEKFTLLEAISCKKEELIIIQQNKVKEELGDLSLQA